MSDDFPIRLMGNDTRTKPESLALGNTSPAAAEKEEVFSNCGFRLVHDDMSRVNRGGNWGDAALHARVGDLDISPPVKRYNDLGFRIARDKEAE